ncbi:MAG: hypothetical protein U0263_12400 [Polyangiaceae bacterium]
MSPRIDRNAKPATDHLDHSEPATANPSPTAPANRKTSARPSIGSGPAPEAAKSTDGLVAGALRGQPNSVAAYARKNSTFAQINRTLERDPSQADRLIEERLTGHSSVDRSIVHQAIAQRGNSGLRKYADAETTLNALGPFSKEERADILGIMKAGANFGEAVTRERAALRQIARPEAKAPRASAWNFETQALANSKALAGRANRLGASVQRLQHEIGSISRAAEVAAGVGSAAGLVGASAVAPLEAVVTGSPKVFGKVLERGDAAGGLIAGELSRKIAAADATAKKFLDASGAFSDARARYDRAVRSRDYPAMTEQSEAMNAAAKEMKRQAASLAEQAKGIAKWNAKFAHAALDMAITAVMTGVSAGLEFHELRHPAEHVMRTIVEDGMRERAVEGATQAAQGHH